MIIGDDGKSQTSSITRSNVTLIQIPTIILTAFTAGGLKIDLLLQTAADIANVQIAGLLIKAEAPRITQAFCPDFWQIGRVVDKGIVGGNAIRITMIDV